LIRITDDNPFMDSNISKHVHITLLHQKPSVEFANKLEDQIFLPGEFLVHENIVYIKCLGKYHQSKLSNQFFEKKLGVTATTRNWNTIIKLRNL
jgi:uncharacterized protein (DUF1697 family)